LLFILVHIVYTVCAINVFKNTIRSVQQRLGYENRSVNAEGNNRSLKII